MKKKDITIMLVDDDVEYGEIVVKGIQMHGYSVIYFSKGKEAINAIKDGKKYDAALIDLSLEDISGAEVISASKDTNPSIRVYTFTGYSISEDDAKRLRADWHMNKSDLSTKEGRKSVFENMDCYFRINES
ncbi:MAG: response regulator [archaeon]